MNSISESFREKIAGMSDSASHTLDFYASMTVCPSDVRKIRTHVAAVGTRLDPLRNVLITPLFASRDTLAMMREMSADGTKVMFDSGGYYVQTGKIRYEELYMPLLGTYRSNSWASVFTLPDHVPTARDNRESVAHKVRDTITYSSIFFQEMPPELRAKAMPVVQGHTLGQIEECLKTYIDLGVGYIGFGSFGTGGKTNEVNLATKKAVELAQHVVEIAHQHGIKVHIFGLGRPALVGMLKIIRADSFDSSSWLKAAGFGNVFLPFMRGYNVTYRNTVGKMDLGVSFDRFRELAELTGHQCPFCDSLELLQARKMYRAIHNLIVMSESVTMANNNQWERIAHIYENGSAKYREDYQKWLRIGS